MLRGFFLLLVSLSLLSMTACKQAPAGVTTLQPADVAAQQSAASAGPVLIDVRSAEEFAAGHIPGALNIPYQEIAERISEVEAPNGVALYCMKGPRAKRGEAALLEAGYGPIYHVEGGLSAWQAAGYDVEREH